MKLDKEENWYLVVEAGDTIEDLIEKMEKTNMRKIDAISFAGRSTFWLGEDSRYEDYVLR